MAGASLSEARRFENIHLTTGKVCRNVADDLGNYCLRSAVLEVRESGLHMRRPDPNLDSFCPAT